MKIRHLVIIAIFLFINIAVIASLNFGGGQKQEEQKEEKVFIQNLSAVSVENKKEVFNVQGFGTVSSFNSVDLSSEVQGKLIQGRHDIKAGVKFSKGDLLYRINDTEARYTLRSRKSNFLNILAVMMPDIRVDFATEYDKWENYIGRVKLNEPLPQLPSWKTNKEKIFLSTRNVLTEYFSIKSAEEQLSKFATYAPYSGMIKDVYVANHAVVNPGSRVMTIVQTGNFEVAVSIPAGQLSAIKIGSECTILTTTGEIKGKGTVVRISDVINRNTQAVTIYVKPVPLEGESFVEGEYLKVAIDAQGEFEGARIPQSSLNDNKVFVYSSSDSTLTEKEIIVLDKNEQGVFVSGLAPKETVITQEVLNFTDSTKYGVLIK